MAYKGKYKPLRPYKYKGNPTKVTYRSLWERKFMQYCDDNMNVLEWASEEMFVWYKSPVDNRAHRYFPDFLIQTDKGWTLIEVKPQVQTKPPKKLLVENLTSKKKRRYVRAVQTWLVNEAKWKAAQKVCEVEGWRFQLMTEKQLQPDK